MTDTIPPLTEPIAWVTSGVMFLGPALFSKAVRTVSKLREAGPPPSCNIRATTPATVGAAALVPKKAKG